MIGCVKCEDKRRAKRQREQQVMPFGIGFSEKRP